MTIVERNNVRISGDGDRTMLFAHGFGCDQNMWRYAAAAFEDTYRVVLFDHVGAGHSDVRQYEREKYGTLDGYATDVLDICEALALDNVNFVGHSVSAMIGVLAAVREPALFRSLVLVNPSPRYIDDDTYVGGFARRDIDELLEALESNFLEWAAAMAPSIMGNPDRPALANELANSFRRTDPDIASHFARVTFLSDNRDCLAGVDAPTLILQSAADIIVPLSVGEFVRDRMARSVLVQLKATGHCPQLSEPAETTAAIRTFLDARL